MMTHTITVASDFYPFPSGRTAVHGPFNGARFRDEFLLPRLEAGQDIIVDLSNLEGKAPSFLDEAFGTLVKYGFSVGELRKRLTLIASDDDVVVEEAWRYVVEQAQKLERSADQLAATH